MAQEGGVRGTNRYAFISSIFPHYFQLFLIDPGPLNSQQLF
jgi:hypothetical protein